MKKVIFIIITLLLITLGSLLLTACTSAQPEIKLETDQIDLGEIAAGEVIERDVRLTNEGEGPLEILSVSTSCGCTTASLDATTLLPGESALLMIRYDSSAHDIDADGSVHRQIFIATNDPNQPEVVINLTADVSDASEN
ncbi:MAG: DUF1573 domain-containing protein [Brevefilum sp.]|nr:DUF1573 domain-containing protein [Brevefilum sp.]